MIKKKIVRPGDFRAHPRWFRTLNRVWKRTHRNGSGPMLLKDELIKKARSATGLQDFGKDFWDEPLEKLIHSLNHEAMLHPIGQYISRKRIVNLLSVRLRAEHLFKKHPEILDQEIYPLMVIVGLQRTGTTKLHRLLTADPDNRVLRSWEALNPVPMDQLENGRDKREQFAKTSEKALKWMAPGFFAIHPVEYSAPEEDILLLDVTFLSTTPEATTHVPSYAEWLEKTDQSMAYEYGSRLLRLLQWQHPGKRWILKSPHHLEFMPLIEKYYGKAQFLWTHRNITECIPSFLSMMSHSRSIFSDHVDRAEVSAHWLRKTSYMLEQGLAYRMKEGKEQYFSDILYEDLLDDSMRQLERIYNGFGGIDDQLRTRFQKAENENPKGKYGIHEYGLEDFGLSEKELIGLNQNYWKLFKLVSR